MAYMLESGGEVPVVSNEKGLTVAQTWLEM